MSTVTTEPSDPASTGTDAEGTGALSREAVLDAAAACYLQYGVAKTTAADIAKAAGTSRATLYRRFGTHEEILLDAVASSIDDASYATSSVEESTDAAAQYDDTSGYADTGYAAAETGYADAGYAAAPDSGYSDSGYAASDSGYLEDSSGYSDDTSSADDWAEG